MAFPTSQNKSIVLLQNLNVRTNDNAPISSLYSVYANGQGQTYWGESFSQHALSSLQYSTFQNYIQLSTSIDTIYRELSTSIVNNVSSITHETDRISTQIALTTITLYSSVHSVLVYDSTIQGIYENVSSSYAFSLLSSYSFLSQSIYYFYLSTYLILDSTLQIVQDVPSYETEFDEIRDELHSGLSSLSTALYTQNTSTYTSLLDMYTSNLQSSLVSSTTAYFTLFGNAISNSDISTFSSIITQQLLSTSAGLYTYISTNDNFISTSISTLYTPTISTFDTIHQQQQIIDEFHTFSTFLYSTTYTWISDYVDINKDLESQSTFSTIFGFSNIIDETSTNLEAVNYNANLVISTLNGELNQNTQTVSSLRGQLSTITASSIVIDINSSFIDLYKYTVSTIDAVSTVQIQTLTSEVNSTCLSVYNNIVANYNTSSFNKAQIIHLNSTNCIGTLDFANYTNFEVSIQNIQDGQKPYQITYFPNATNGVAFNKGILSLYVNTVGQNYSTNQGRLRLDLYHWGFPTCQNELFYPTIGNSDYTIQYGYTILQNIVYTNFLNVYPRLATTNIKLSTIHMSSVLVSNNLSTSGGPAPNYFWRGEPLQVSWSNYSYFPFASTGMLNYNPQVIVDVVAQGSTFSTYGPFSLGVSTTTIQLPYIRSLIYVLPTPSSPVVPTTIRSYIQGNPMNATETVVNVVVPAFSYFSMTPKDDNFLMGSELVGITDDGQYPLFNADVRVSSVSGNYSYANSTMYVGTNLVNGILNGMGWLGTHPILLYPAQFGFPSYYGEFVDYSAAQPIGSQIISFLIMLGPSYQVNPYPVFGIISSINPYGNLGSLQDYGLNKDETTYPGYDSVITATIRDSVSSITFQCHGSIDVNFYWLNISASGADAYKPIGSYRYTSPNTTFSFTYTPVSSIFNTPSYSISTFIGPASSITGDPTAKLSFSISTVTTQQNTSYFSPISTLTFYNNVDTSTPTYNYNISGNLVSAYVYDYSTNLYFGSSFILTNSLQAQVFSV